MAAQDLVPARRNLRPSELPGPLRAVDRELGSLLTIRQQLDGRRNPPPLCIGIVEAVKEPARRARCSFANRNLDPELDAVSERADVGGDRNAAAGLRFADRDAVDFHEFGRIRQDRCTLIELRDLRMREMAERLYSGLSHVLARTLHPADAVGVAAMEKLEEIPAISPLQPR